MTDIFERPRLSSAEAEKIRVRLKDKIYFVLQASLADFGSIFHDALSNNQLIEVSGKTRTRYINPRQVIFAEQL